jgi:hypothetical protein
MSRTRVLQFRLSDYEFEQLQQEADRQGVPMADLLRKYIARLPEPKIEKANERAIAQKTSGGSYILK